MNSEWSSEDLNAIYIEMFAKIRSNPQSRAERNGQHNFAGDLYYDKEDGRFYQWLGDKSTDTGVNWPAETP
jgi:hypothetical protein